MVLVPAEEAGKWTEPMTGGGAYTPTVEPKTVQTPGDPVSRLDAELSSILQSRKYHDDGEKWKQYLQVLQRYLFLVGARSGSEDPSLPDTATQESTIPKDFNEAAIIKSVPLMHKRRATALIDYLRNSPVASQRITWDRAGLVTIDGMLIPNSNILDLINDAVRARKDFKATGRRQFIQSLRAISVPREFIGNDALWNIGDASVSIKRKRINPTDSGAGNEEGSYSDDGEEADEDHSDSRSTASGNTSKNREEKKEKTKKKGSTRAVKRPSKRQNTGKIEIPRGFAHWLKL